MSSSGERAKARGVGEARPSCLSTHPPPRHADGMSKRVSQRDFVVADDDDDELLREDEDESDLDGDSDSSGGIARLRSKGATNRGATQRDAVGTRSATGAARSSKGKGKAWEGQFERTWDQVQEDDRGTLEGAVSDLLLSTKSRRCARPALHSTRPARPTRVSSPSPSLGRAGCSATLRPSSEASSATSTSSLTSLRPCSSEITRPPGSTSPSSTPRCVLVVSLAWSRRRSLHCLALPAGVCHRVL